MKYVMVADIFGKTKALETLAQSVSSDVCIIDPYQGNDMHFADEAAAYHYFMHHVGLQQYIEYVAGILQQHTALRVVGFSVGASAVWQASEQLTSVQVNAAVLFYGSQIRHAIGVTPNFATTMIFPKQESHFCVRTLMDSLATKDNVNCYQSDYLHGFMNRHSAHFDEQCYEHYLAVLKTWSLTPVEQSAFSI